MPAIRAHIGNVARSDGEACNAAAARFPTVFDNAAIALGIGDAERRVIDVDPAFGAMLDGTP
ncbi:hypothetical protein [Nocardia vermiculata]|uniref:Uncharacterized protein n=1 Tax=Nocardia vermiculata TaxID=257274 RepID=A0A846Y7W2_9NOCA|nr:hypothetical protein [Nocardia vermiculata]NKY53328.1 hypothetical protein [Nocardia vermiculata]